jgi:DNA-binding beta-propeller fold protein YncE
MRHFAVLLCAATAVCAQPFHLEKTIPLPGVEGRIDHLAMDVKGHRLLLSALGTDEVEVIDVAGGAILHKLPGMHEPQGTSYVPASNKIYVANGKDGKLRIYDAASYKSAGEVEFGDDADNVRYDAAQKWLWVGYADGGLAAVDIATGKRVKEIYIDGHPESFQIEKNGSRIFANVPDAREIEVVDRIQGKILAKWPMVELTKNFPMALDEANHRLIVACRKPAKLVVIDMETGKIVAQLDCPGDSDDIFYDAARKRIYVAGGDGTLEAFAQKSADEYQSLGKIKTAEGARTALFVPDMNRLYLAVPHKGANPRAEVRVYTID